jgi:hypothetical protein
MRDDAYDRRGALLSYEQVGQFHCASTYSGCDVELEDLKT